MTLRQFVFTSRHGIAISQHAFLLEACSNPPPSKQRARGCRAADAPDSRVCSPTKKTHTRSSGTLVITGLDPVIHLLRKSLSEDRWIAGSSPVMTSVPDER